MAIFLVAILLAFSTKSVHASPFSSLARRNVCDWVNAEPILYTEYHSDVCPPPKNFADGQGNCELSFKDRPQCENFCQVRTTFVYGREQPFPNNPYCHGGITCTITETQTTSWTTQLNINPAAKGDVMSIGTTGSLSYGSSWAQARAYSVNPGKDSQGDPICGYFTFLPITKFVCGTYTTGTPHDVPHDHCDNISSKPNICADATEYNPPEHWYSKAKKARGDTIFVYTNCSNRQPLPMEKQDPAYRHGGVPLDRGTRDIYDAVWGDPKVLPLVIPNPVTCFTDDNSPTFDDASDAINGLIGRADLAPIGPNGYHWLHSGDSIWADVQLDYQQDWDPNCRVTYHEMATTALMIRDACTNKATGKVSGTKQMRVDGKCNSSIRIVASSN